MLQVNFLFPPTESFSLTTNMAAVLLWQSICFLCAMGSARAHASKATSGVQSLVSRHDSQRVIEYCATTALTTTSMSTTAASPGIMFLNGWMSSMNSTKALFLEDYCQSTGRPFCRFEWFQEGGGGDHPSTSSEPCISTWLEDALQILDQVTDGPQLLVGSSMGAWLGLHICRQRPERIHSLVGIASAPDFSQTFIEPRLSEDQRSQLQTRGYCAWETPYQSTPYRLTQHFLDDARSYNILSENITMVKQHPFPLAIVIFLCDSFMVTVIQTFRGRHPQWNWHDDWRRRIYKPFGL